jgi:hypothetical protein
MNPEDKNIFKFMAVPINIVHLNVAYRDVI